jgi:cohesin loading factor subunit SCC2
MSDTSPAVRDAAVELIGRHLIQQPQVIDKYYAKISERVGVSGRVGCFSPLARLLTCFLSQDSSLAVRKRAIKLLKTIYNSLVQTPRRADIAVKLLSRWEDEDEGVKVRQLLCLLILLAPSKLGFSLPRAGSRSPHSRGAVVHRWL